ncbi:MAG: Ni/Fe hydrogenase subunit alpha [Acidimicrobiales bacterium]|nr:Ni/Fe hydrogenase subunit alpha [Acidimicrobiales bacterium]
MTHRAGGGRALDTGALSRVEGEGAMHVRIENGQVIDVQLNIYEPPRYFEGFLRGRRHTEPPDITARICGICPVAYQMSACRAVEDACGADVTGQLRSLRQLLYCGEWIESHSLHVHLLHAPDFLGCASAVELAASHRAEVQRGLEIKKIGNEILELLGGRAIHPVNVRVGGFYRTPDRAELTGLRTRIDRALGLAVEVVDWVAGFDFPDADLPHELVALVHPDEYAVLSGRVRSSAGLDIDEREFSDHIAEHQVAHSTAKHARLLERGEYLVGPLARYALSGHLLSPAARRLASKVGLGEECRNPFRSIVVRAVEVVHACETALALIDAYVPPDAPAVTVVTRSGTGHGATEAPRGLLYHRYELDEDGIIRDAVIVPPTSQNQATIEHELWHFVEDNLDLPDDELHHWAEVLIRNHDPCISCATHFLDLRVDRS